MIGGPVQLINEDWAPTITKTPRAQRDQATSSEWDKRLTALARRSRYTVAWWWGTRKLIDGTFAFCYVCNARIIRISGGSGLSDKQRTAILEHRASHYLLIKDGSNE